MSNPFFLRRCHPCVYVQDPHSHDEVRWVRQKKNDTTTTEMRRYLIPPLYYYYYRRRRRRRRRHRVVRNNKVIILKKKLYLKHEILAKYKRIVGKHETRTYTKYTIIFGYANTDKRTREAIRRDVDLSESSAMIYYYHTTGGPREALRNGKRSGAL